MIARINPDLEKLCRPIDELKSDPNNARKHSERNIMAIAESLQLYGQLKPVVCKGDVVIAGNGTLEAAKRLGWDKLAVTQFEGPGKSHNGYALADNRTAELAEWDFDVLSNQLGLFENQLELGSLWSGEELSALKGLNKASTAGTVGPSPSEKKAIFENASIKQIVLYMEDEQYKNTLTSFRNIAGVNDLVTNTEVVLFLLKNYENPQS